MTDQQLVPVFTGHIQGAQHQLCNARDLHTFIESKRKFADWIKDRIEQFGFQEDADYIVHKFVNNSGQKVIAAPSAAFEDDAAPAGRPSLDYHLTLDMAKELAMVENNDKGRQVRRYFIELEKRAHDAVKRVFPSTAGQIATHGLRLKLLDRLEFERNPAKRLAVHQQLDQISRLLGLPTPPLDAIGRDSTEPNPNHLLGDFWGIYHQLNNNPATPQNHSHTPDRIAINLGQLTQAANTAGLTLPPRTTLLKALPASTAPRCLGNRTVNSKITGKSVKCWVFLVEQIS